ncbi:histidine phosphatase family protein [Streptomyces sp. ACA25]|nr:histidine phosphatase family protein [Streptomyces sp. ACA25]MDB1086754.1 histidine phosphatase family protein [Streptomyces sp. ACA25]
MDTARIAFEGTTMPTHQDHRLRECDYGHLNGCPQEVLAALRSRHMDVPFPGGQSYRDVVRATGDFLTDLTRRQPRSADRPLRQPMGPGLPAHRHRTRGSPRRSRSLEARLGVHRPLRRVRHRRTRRALPGTALTSPGR